MKVLNTYRDYAVGKDTACRVPELTSVAWNLHVEFVNVTRVFKRSSK